MYIKLIGAIMIVLGCGGYGFYMAASYKAEENALYRLITVLEYMQNELQYRLTPLPVLCKHASQETSGVIRTVFYHLYQELEAQNAPDVSRCMRTAIKKTSRIPPITCHCLRLLGSSLGRFDLQGQLRGLDSVSKFCNSKAAELSNNKDVRIRSYQTLSLCAGAALAVLLI